MAFLSGPSKTNGFTLIEVLVALAIVTVGMSAVLGAMTSSADTAIYLRDKSFAQWIALNRIAETRLKGQIPAKGKTEGDLDFAEGKWHWQQEVLPLQVKGMWRIDVSVRPVGKSTAWYTTESGVVGDGVDYNLNELIYMDRAQGFKALPQ
jgi:general secretion pathway protein I